MLIANSSGFLGNWFIGSFKTLFIDFPSSLSLSTAYFFNFLIQVQLSLVYFLNPSFQMTSTICKVDISNNYK